MGQSNRVEHILVTGASGYIGSRLVKIALDEERARGCRTKQQPRPPRRQLNRPKVEATLIQQRPDLRLVWVNPDMRACRHLQGQ